MNEPQYGYGEHRRPLRSPRDREAEAIRRLLRGGGFKDAGEHHLEGFSVEGADASDDDDEPFRVVYHGTMQVAGTLRIYTALLENAGLSVAGDPAHENVLVVQRPPALPPDMRGLWAAATACWILACAGIAASWLTSGLIADVSKIGGLVAALLGLFLTWRRHRRLGSEAAALLAVMPPQRRPRRRRPRRQNA